MMEKEEIEQLRQWEEASYPATRRILGGSVSLLQDLFGLYELLGTPPVRDERVKAGHWDIANPICLAWEFLVACRYQLNVGALALFRAHLYDSLSFLRVATELCAFAVRITKQPNLAEVWLHARNDAASYKAYRRAFSPKELFPKSDALLAELYDQYDYCSRHTHPSVSLLARQIELPSNSEFQLEGDDPSELVDEFMRLVRTHFVVLLVFEGLFCEVLAPNRTRWEACRDAAKLRIEAHKAMWTPIMAAMLRYEADYLAGLIKISRPRYFANLVSRHLSGGEGREHRLD